MEQLRSDLTSRGLDYNVIDPQIQKLIAKTEARYRGLSEEKRKEYIDKLIDIFADAESNLDALKSDTGFRSYLDRTDKALTMVRIGVENPELMEIRDKLYRMVNFDSIPENNHPVDQIIMAIYDEVLYGLGDLAITLYKAGGGGELLKIIKEIGSTLVSVELYEGILKQSAGGLKSFIFDWGGDDMLYRKFRQGLVIAGIPALARALGKKLLKTSLKKATIAGVSGGGLYMATHE